mgnify:CR=1 FL=1
MLGLGILDSCKAPAFKPLDRGDPFLENKKEGPTQKESLIQCSLAIFLPEDLDLWEVEELQPSFKMTAKERFCRKSLSSSVHKLTLPGKPQ